MIQISTDLRGNDGPRITQRFRIFADFLLGGRWMGGYSRLSMSLFLSILIYLILCILLFANHSHGSTITVDDDEDADFRTIQDAVDSSEDGDVVIVWSGMYVENVVINSSISLIGNGAVISGARRGDVVIVNSNHTNISGFRLINSIMENSRTWYYRAGLVVLGHNCSIMNNSFSSNLYGIHLSSSNNCTISDNLFSYNYRLRSSYPSGVAVFLRKSHGNIISNNSCHHNEGAGIWLEDSSFNIVELNVCNENGGSGIEINGYSGWNTIRNNDCISNAFSGITVGSWSYANEIRENRCSNNYRDGIRMYRTDYNLVIGNSISGNSWDGIHAGECHDERIFNNSIKNNGHSGIEVVYSFGVRMENNSIIGNRYGIRLGFYDISGDWGEEGNTNVMVNNILLDNEKDFETYITQSWLNANSDVICFLMLAAFVLAAFLLAADWAFEPKMSQSRCFPV